MKLNGYLKTLDKQWGEERVKLGLPVGATIDDITEASLKGIRQDALVSSGGGRKRRLTEKGLNRVRDMWLNHDTGTITAFRGVHDCGDGDVINRKENASRNTILKRKLMSLGYGVTNVNGSWFENGGEEIHEASFFVVDINDKDNLKNDLMRLGEENDQDSVIYAKAGGDFNLISTNKCPNSEPGLGKIGVEVKIGQPKFGKTGIYGFSRVGKRAFVFEEVYLNHNLKVDTKISNGLSERRAIHHIFERYPNKQSILDLGKDNG